MVNDSDTRIPTPGDRPAETAPANRARQGNGFRLAAVGAVFAVSGVSALVYQVAWQRILALHSGAGIYSVAMIVGAFLAGLGLGSWVGAVLSRRSGPRQALLAFAGLELGVGLFALASPFLYYDVLYLRAPWLYGHWWLAGPVHFVILLAPTSLMGMSLPFLVKAMVRDPAIASRTVGLLYGLNVLGAAAGALAAPWVLIRFMGLEGAIAVGAAGNLVAGTGALIVGRLRPPEEPVTPPATCLETGIEPAGSRPFGLWMMLYGVSGFCALSLEILWFRIVDVAVKSTTFTFGTVLAIFLLGLGIGSVAGGRWAPQVRRPLLGFLSCQTFLLAYSALAAFLLVTFPTGTPVYARAFAYWSRYEAFAFGLDWDPATLLLLYVAIPVFLSLPPTFLMGISFAILQRAVHDDAGTSGFKVGVLQAVNIVGNVAGSLVTGLVLLHWLGTPGTFRVLILFGVGFAALGVRYYGMRWALVVPGAVLLLLLTAFPTERRFWARLHGIENEPSIFAEDASGLAAIVPEREWRALLRVSINGKGHSNLPFHNIHSHLGSIPSLIHPDPRHVVIIGLGSGDTAWASGCRPETETVRVFEIVAPVETVLRRLNAEQVPALGRFLSDPRVKIEIADGRNALAREETLYDVIEADALRPQSAFAGNLYSTEFFELCARRLKPGGIMSAWAPTPRTYRTFTRVFPHVVEFSAGQILLGSNEPISIDIPSWQAKLQSPGLSEYLGGRVFREVRSVLGTARPAQTDAFDRHSPNRDLFPRDEFLTPPLYDMPR